MFIVANFLTAVAKVLDIAITLYIWLIIIRAIISWVSADPFNPIVQILNKATDPVLFRIRRLLPFSLKWGVDISPMIAVLCLVFLQSFLVNTLFETAQRLRLAG